MYYLILTLCKAFGLNCVKAWFCAATGIECNGSLSTVFILFNSLHSGLPALPVGRHGGWQDARLIAECFHELSDTAYDSCRVDRLVQVFLRSAVDVPCDLV